LELLAPNFYFVSLCFACLRHLEQYLFKVSLPNVLFLETRLL